MLAMSFLALGIVFLQYVMELLEDVINPFNKYSFLISLILRMGRFFLCEYNGKRYVNWAQRMEPQAYLKRAMDSIDMKGSMVSMLNIRKTLIPCEMMFGVVHS
jgi:hypothetical protein